MPRTTPLTDTLIRSIKATDKLQKYFDGQGLYLQITPSGSKRWRFKYRFEGKEKLLSLGLYPDVSLKEARKQRQHMRTLLAQGIDPSQQRKAIKLAKRNQHSHNFEIIAREWFAKHEVNWAKSHASKIIRRLELNIFPRLGTMTMDMIDSQTLLTTIQRIEQRGALETAHRTLNNCSQVFRYAIATSRCQQNPCDHLRGALPPVKSKHLAAVVEPEAVRDILLAIDSYQGTMVVQSALKLAPLVFVRPNELRQAKWENINFDTKEWRYKVSKTKTEHIVPLANQAIATLKELQPVTSYSLYVFPSARSPKRPMSDNAVLSALRRLEIPKEVMTGHGFRATARTMLDEILGFRPDYIEHQLAHAVKDPNGRAYNRTAHLKERKVMMQTWADYLDQLRGGAI